MCASGRACVHWRLLCQGVPETRHGRAGCHRTRNSSSPSFRVSRNVCPLEVRVCLTFEPLGLISLRLLGKGGRETEETARIWNKSETGDRLWSVAQPHFRHVCFEKQRKKWDSLFFIFLKVYIDGCAVLFPLSINVYKALLFMAIKNIFFSLQNERGKLQTLQKLVLHSCHLCISIFPKCYSSSKPHEVSTWILLYTPQNLLYSLLQIE